MKNFKNFLLLSLCLTTLLFISCAEQSDRGKDAKQKTAVEAPKQIISIEVAKSMYDNYTKRRAGLIQKFEDSINASMKETKKFDVARYTYYDYKTIKDYLAYIEQEAEKAGVEISTLRFYYSNYPDQQKFPDGTTVVHPRQNSFFIMPTLNQEGREYGFYTEDSGENGEKKAVLLDWQLELFAAAKFSEEEKDARSLAGFGPNTGPLPAFARGSLVLNQGGAAPPPYQ